MIYSNSNTLVELNRKARRILDGDGSDGIRSDVQWYVDSLIYYGNMINEFEKTGIKKDKYLLDSNDPKFKEYVNFEGVLFQYSYWFEAMVWCIQNEVARDLKRHKKGGSDGQGVGGKNSKQTENVK